MNRKVRTEVEELVEDLKKEEEVESLESVLFTMDELIEGFDSLLEG